MIATYSAVIVSKDAARRRPVNDTIESPFASELATVELIRRRLETIAPDMLGAGAYYVLQAVNDRAYLY